MASSGSSVLVFVDVGTNQWEAVAEQTNLDISATADSQEFGHKQTSVKRTIAGSITMDLTLDALRVYSSVHQQQIINAFFSKQRIKIREYFEGNPAREFVCAITSINESHPEGAPSTMNVSFRVDGQPLTL